MKQREFVKITKACVNPETGMYDVDKLLGLSDDTKSKLVYFLVGNRHAVIQELIPPNFDMEWLASMGYLYRSKNKYFTFVHSSENKPLNAA
jgi:hypothetical protein